MNRPKKAADVWTRIRYPAVALFLLLQVYFFFIKTAETLDLDISPNTIPTPLIFKTQTVGQAFVAESDNVSRVDIMIGTLGRPSDKDLIFKLYEIMTGSTLVRRVAVKASHLLNNGYNAFVFPPLKKSNGRTYAFYLSAPAAYEGNAVCAWMNAANIYKKGTAYINGQPDRGDLVFKVYAQRPLASELIRVVKRNPGSLGNTWLFILSIALFEGAAVLVLIKYPVGLRTRRKRQDGKQCPNNQTV
jgi:hypothetical protein